MIDAKRSHDPATAQTVPYRIGASPTICIASDELAAMLAGQLPPDHVEAILVHVDACAACAEVMAHLGRLDDAPHDLGRYQLGRALGSGAMGIVYEAWDPQLERRVAIKLVRPEHADASSRMRMLREARALARVSHPNVVALYDASEHAGRLCVATELVDGETLGTWQVGRSVEAIVEAWLQAARGLAAAHAGGVIHRDVKPSNVLVGRDGRVRVGDFGLARLGAGPPEPELDGPPPRPLPRGSGDDLCVTRSGYVAGTPGYMAPEQARGRIDARSDQYALCVALAEAVTGRRPGADADDLVPDRPALDAALVRGLRSRPEQRFPTMTALADALAAAIAPPRAAPPRRVGLIALGAAAALVAGAAIAGLTWPSRPDCAPAAVPTALWSPARRAAVSRHIPASVPPRVDAWLAAWSSGAASVCAVDRDDLVLRARRDRCLADQLDQLDHLLGRWQAGGDVAAMAAHEALEDLPRASRCSHAAEAAIADPAPDQRGEVAEIRRALALALDDDDPAALPAVRALLARARATGHAPLVVEVAIPLSNLEAAGDRAAAAATLRDAIAAADRAGAELPRITARTQLIAILGAERPDEAAELAEAARGLIARIGGDAELEANLELAIGNGLAARNSTDASIAAYERARRGFRTAYGPDSGHEVIALLSLMAAYTTRGTKLKEARAARAAALAINQRAGLGMPLDGFTMVGSDPDGLIRETERWLEIARRDHPRSEAELETELDVGTAYVLADRPESALAHLRHATALGDELGVRNEHMARGVTQIASLLVDLGRTAEAAPIARRAVELAQALGDDEVLGTALTALGSTLIDRDPRTARDELQRALAALDRAQASATDRARTRFLLATALWPADPRRALDLAHGARADSQSVIDTLAPDDPSADRVRRHQRERVAAIDRWLATHHKR